MSETESPNTPPPIAAALPRSEPAPERSTDGDAHATRERARGQERVTRTGLTSLMIVARHHGLDWSFDRLLHLYSLDREPSSEELAKIAREEGLQCAIQSTRWEELSHFQKTLPILAHRTNGTFVVVQHGPAKFVNRAKPGGEQTPESLLIFDPQRPEVGLHPVAREEFERSWTGEVLLLKRVYKLTDEKQPFSLRWFFPEVWKQRSLFSNVIAAALALHVLALAVPLFFQIVIDRVLVHLSISTLEVMGLGVGIAILFDAAMSWLRGYFLLHGSSKIDIRLARITFRHLLGLPIGFFEHALAGVITKHMQQATQIRDFITGKLFSTILDLPVLFVFLPILFIYNWSLALMVLFAAGLLAGIIGSLIGPFRRRLRRLYRAEAERQSLLVETIHGMRTVKVLNLEPRRQNAWETASAQAVKLNVEVGKFSLSANVLSQLIEKSLSISIIIFGAFAVFRGRMSVGELVAFNMLAGRVVGPILQFVGLLNQFQEVLLSVDMLGEIMNRAPETNLERGITARLRGEIALDGVRFRYPGSDRFVLDHISLRFPAGSMVGIVGRSGSGKTTLSALLQGLYAPSEGLVRIDGFNIRELDLTAYRNQIGVVTQDPFLFRGSVKDNIRIALPSASFEEVVQAARLAGANGFIDEMPQGYDTLLEENGVNLSGGQKQRLSIARALLRQPRILIFDEATSALDPESEAIIMRNLAHIARGRTTVLISHRLNTVAGADMIVVIDNGKLLDVGNHEVLLQRNLVYRQLWNQQRGTTA
jgi:subfamily B ATP-binding cassette protein HlyB/CyaB